MHNAFEGGMRMFYVYCRHMASGREDFSGMYETAKEAIEHITGLYNMDRNLKQLGEYYYFMKQH
jgi:hypothetical protein